MGFQVIEIESALSVFGEELSLLQMLLSQVTSQPAENADHVRNVHVRMGKGNQLRRKSAVEESVGEHC